MDIPYSLVEVYPRECGGTDADHRRYAKDVGLSPRVRGNRALGLPADVRWRSIPASAGEPVPLAAVRRPLPVYPRECGGTTF